MEYKRILWTSLLVLAVGILLLVYPISTLDLFVRILGALFLGAAALNILLQLLRTRSSSKAKASILGLLTAVASGALGLWMLLAPAGFSTAMVYILGAFMIIGGVYLILTMALTFRPIKFPFGFYILPLLVAICGIVICLLPPADTKNAIDTVTGIAMIVYGVGAIIEVTGVISMQRALRTPGQTPADDPQPTHETEETTQITQ